MRVPGIGRASFLKRVENPHSEGGLAGGVRWMERGREAFDFFVSRDDYAIETEL